MKHTLHILAAVAAWLITTPSAHAQAPLAAQPQQAQTSLAPTADSRAAIVAAQLIQQIDYTFGAVQRAITVGIPARGTQPAVSADAVKAALGPDNLAKIQAAAAALAPPKSE